MLAKQKIIKIFILNLLFWVPTLMVLFLYLQSDYQIIKKIDQIENVPLFQIIWRNLIVVLTLILSGIIHKMIPYFIFGLNAFYFSIMLLMSDNVIINLFQVSKYGIIEVFALSIACFIGVYKDYFLTWLPVILILTAALIEHKVIIREL
ncbi:MAG: hypothetical protein LBC17_03650 [Lactobacillaceae bacterium]|jgi:hypothetical protein|nr:hypothetical protein [Lactobacillaceae bacterium]